MLFEMDAKLYVLGVTRGSLLLVAVATRALFLATQFAAVLATQPIVFTGPSHAVDILSQPDQR